MKTIEYTTIDKSAWRRGEWDNEPDKVQWQDEATGLPCLVKRNGMVGILCGYVGVDSSHPHYGKGYSELIDIDVHGGLTYAAGCSHGDETTNICHIPSEGEPDNVWWFGFDCNHCFDFAPGMPYMGDGGYRNLAYVKSVCTQLARQLVLNIEGDE